MRTHDATPPHLDVFPASGKLQRFAWVFAGHVQQNASKRPSKRPQKCVQDAPLGVLGPPTWPILHPRQKKIEKILKMVSQMETCLALGAPFRSLGPPLGGPRGENIVPKANFMHIVKTSIFTCVFACFWRSGLAEMEVWARRNGLVSGSGAPNGRLCSTLGFMWGPFGDFWVQKMLH